jgi:hypothetical protein
MFGYAKLINLESILNTPKALIWVSGTLFVSVALSRPEAVPLVKIQARSSAWMSCTLSRSLKTNQATVTGYRKSLGFLGNRPNLFAEEVRFRLDQGQALIRDFC